MPEDNNQSQFELFVLVWREANSRRLRTYANADNTPIASPMKNIFPVPQTVIESSDDLTVWLNSPPTDETIAVSVQVASSDLGWDPHAPIPAPALEETS